MPRLVLGALVVGFLFAAYHWLRPVLKNPGQRRRLGLRALWLLAAAVAAVLFLRFGLHWLVVLGSVLLAASRRLLPLLRYLPFARQLWARHRASGGPSGPSGRPPPGSGGEAPRSGRASMTRQEALEVLGLASDASRSDVEREYRRLMKKLHPDVGGSGYLAGKLNQAREVLLS